MRVLYVVVPHHTTVPFRLMDDEREDFAVTASHLWLNEE